MTVKIDLSETAEEQWNNLEPQEREDLLIEFEAAIELTYTGVKR